MVRNNIRPFCRFIILYNIFYLIDFCNNLSWQGLLDRNIFIKKHHVYKWNIGPVQIIACYRAYLPGKLIVYSFHHVGFVRCC